MADRLMPMGGVRNLQGSRLPNPGKLLFGHGDFGFDPPYVLGVIHLSFCGTQLLLQFLNSLVQDVDLSLLLLVHGTAINPR